MAFAQRRRGDRRHPDRFADPLMKARAEETFKEAEDVFRQIATGQ